VPVTDFPDIRARATIQSPTGAALLLPREQEKVRFYVQLDPHRQFFDDSGKFDMNKISPDKIVNVSSPSQTQSEGNLEQ
jgi:phenol 2-monooxygenase